MDLQMKPVAAVSGPGKLAFALAYDATAEPCVTVLMQDVHVWVDARLLLRLQRLVASIPASRHQEDLSDSQASLALRLFASSCSISYCLLSTSAVTLAVAPGATLSRLFTEYDKTAFHADDVPFCSVRGDSIAISSKQAHMLHLRVKDPSSQVFDLADIGVASDLQISALFNSLVDLPEFCSALPGTLASSSEFDTYGMCLGGASKGVELITNFTIFFSSREPVARGLGRQDRRQCGIVHVESKHDTV